MFLSALCAFILLTTVTRGNQPLMFGAMVVPVALMVFAVLLMRRRRRVLCGQI